MPVDFKLSFAASGLQRSQAPHGVVPPTLHPPPSHSRSPPRPLLQGKKQAGRLQTLAGYYAALQVALELLGLWSEAPWEVLRELRQLALTRWVCGGGGSKRGHGGREAQHCTC